MIQQLKRPEKLRLYVIVKALNSVVKTRMQELLSNELLAHIVDSEW